MTITLELPDDVASRLGGSGEGISRAALEALALEGYRTGRLTESELRRMLGLATRIEVHAFLKERGATLNYSPEDLEHDREVARRLSGRRNAELRRTG